jgi:GrpB-like predicted nucleotidyltransferase (UPF0157 family)
MTMARIEIIPYSDRWPDEFRQISAAIRQVLDNLAVRIDHIGSTSVPGLPAKDVIDIQVTVKSLEPEAPIVDALSTLGYTWRDPIKADHLPPDTATSPEEWQKLMFRGPANQRRINLHVRVEGKPNQRYALLFRDYLRAHPVAAAGYAEVKRQLARYHPDDMEAYYDVKDPVCDIIMAGAEEWAATTRWRPGPSDA